MTASAVQARPRPMARRAGIPLSTTRAIGSGFLLAGSLAFATDAGGLWLLTTLGWSPLAARVGAILVALVVAWLAHRRLTFRMAIQPTFAEFGRYAAVAWSSAALNYVVFAGILLLLPETRPFLALVALSLVAMTLSYVGMRFAAFRIGAAR